MTPMTAIPASTGLLAQLADSAVRTVFLGAVAGLSMLAFRVRATPARLFTWTAVLYAALAMPLLGGMLPPLPIPTPAFLPSRAIQSAHLQSLVTQPTQVSLTSGDVTSIRSVAGKEKSTTKIANLASHVVHPLGGTQSIVVDPRRPASVWSSIPWNAVAVGIYFAVALLLLARLLVGLIFARRLVRSSQEIHEPRVTRRLASCSHACGLVRIPSAVESEVISVPVTVGILRPTILLPDRWCEWDDAKLDAVIAHEVSHVARGDALTQRVSLLHRAIFWFSPLAWWLDRHLADLAEQASDEAALCNGADRGDYAKTLLGFLAALQTAPGRVWWQGVAMAKAGQAEQRVERILRWKDAGGNIAMGLKKSVAVMIVALAIPAAYVAASAHPVNHQICPAVPSAQDFALPAALATASQEVPPAPASAPHTPPAPTEPVTGTYSESGPPPIAPSAPTGPTPPIAPTMPGTPAASSAAAASAAAPAHGSYSYSYGNDDESRFVIVSGNSDSVTMSGSTEDVHHAQRLRKQIPGDFIWFERDEKSYIISDQATIARARKFWAPQEALTKKQEELSRQQEALSKQQEALSEKQRQVQVKVPDMTVQLDKLKAELKQLGSGATQDQLSKIQSEMSELQSHLSEMQSQASAQQSELSEQQSTLSGQQGKLSEQQSELSRQQSELSRQADRQMRELLDESIRNGMAKPETDMGKATL
jgi:beta-lactamase regulating signal transducer with metallopeptidase domain